MFIIALLFLIIGLCREATEPTIPADNWRNKELFYIDYMNPDISYDEVLNNVKAGKYIA